MSQSYPWLKLPHREYLVSLTYKALKPVERLAFIELVMFAHTQENNALPDNDKFLAAWASMSLKQWLKVKANVLTEWLLVDGFWQLPTWFVIEQPTPKNTTNDTDNNVTAKQQRNAERQKRYRERNANRNDVTQESVTRNADSNATVTHSNVTRNANECNESVTIGGIKGGDLDLDLEQDLDLDKKLNSHSKTREAEKKSPRFFDDELRPDVTALNAKLGANLVTEEFITQNLFAFNSHYETKCLTENQRLAKWINWFKSEEAKKQAQTIQRPKQATSKTWQSKEDERKAFNKAAMDEFVNGCSGSNIIDGEARHVI